MNQTTDNIIDDLYEEIQNLTAQIHTLESALAILIHKLVYDTIYKGDGMESLNVGTFTENAERYIHIPHDSQELIRSLGGDRKFIEKFLSPSTS